MIASKADERRLKHEIQAALAEKSVRTVGTDPPMHAFAKLLRDEDPDAMEVAEDVLLRAGMKMREATGGLHARNFTIELRPLWMPREDWRMVQTSVDAVSKRPGYFWMKWSAANGRARASVEKTFRMSDLDEAKLVAVATAWHIAKILKRTPIDGLSDASLREVIERAVAHKKQNALRRALF